MARVRYDPVSGEKIPKLKRDWEGRHVRLKRALETKGGAMFDLGDVMLVHRNFSGLELEAVKACSECRLKYRHCVKNVSEFDVTLLPEDFEPPADVVSLTRLPEAG